MTIAREGIKPELFSSFLGASGGPKWFSLFGLDKYIFGEFFKQRQQTLSMLGSSAGAFRIACFAQKDPVAAISRLAQYYSETVYSANADAEEISSKARVLLTEVLGKKGCREIIHNPVFHAHFVVARTKGLVASERKLLQLAGLLSSYAFNRIDRKLLRNQYDRYVFQHPASTLSFEDPAGFNTHRITLTPDNLADALLASGSIPMVMQGITDIPGGARGMYRDGGIIDYHFDLKINSGEGLCLYPHFSASPKAGWFDKKLARTVHPDNYANIVMLVPSAEFIARLPYGKIPDREDFTQLDAAERIRYWKTVLAETERLADAFAQFIHAPQYKFIKAID